MCVQMRQGRVSEQLLTGSISTCWLDVCLLLAYGAHGHAMRDRTARPHAQLPLAPFDLNSFFSDV